MTYDDDYFVSKTQGYGGNDMTGYSLSISDRLHDVEIEHVLRDIAMIRAELDNFEDAAKAGRTYGVVTSYDYINLLTESGRRFILEERAK